MSLFVTFEGGEGCGKSYQARALYRWLTQLAVPAILTHEPGGTLVGERISRLVKWGREINISPLTELLLFNASRSQLITEVIKPALKEGKIVVCDRFADSTIAYQSYGRGLDLAMVAAVNKTATQDVVPDLTFLLDVPVEVGLARKKDRKHDRFELEEVAFHNRVREGYLILANREPTRWVVVDGSQSKNVIAGVIRAKIEELLKYATHTP